MNTPASLAAAPTLLRKVILNTARKALRQWVKEQREVGALRTWINDYLATNEPKYSKYLYTESAHSALNVSEVAPVYNPDAELVDARIVVRDNLTLF